MQEHSEDYAAGLPLFTSRGCNQACVSKRAVLLHSPLHRPHRTPAAPAAHHSPRPESLPPREPRQPRRFPRAVALSSKHPANHPPPHQTGASGGREPRAEPPAYPNRPFPSRPSPCRRQRHPQVPTRATLLGSLPRRRTSSSSRSPSSFPRACSSRRSTPSTGSSPFFPGAPRQRHKGAARVS